MRQVQSHLAADEALVLFLDTPEWKPTPEETFIWVVTKTDSALGEDRLGTQPLQREVAALRCGLDEAAWSGEGPRSHCAELLKTQLLGRPAGNAGKPLPFDLNRAHALYKALFGQIEDLIKDKHLLIVPSGALTQLPFQVLVSEQPDPGPRWTRGFAPGDVARQGPCDDGAAVRLIAQGAAPVGQGEPCHRDR